MRSGRAFSCSQNESESTVRDVSKRTTILGAARNVELQRVVLRRRHRESLTGQRINGCSSTTQRVSTLSFGADSLDGCVCIFPGAYFVGHLCAVNLPLESGVLSGCFALAASTCD